jgi:hypothetical protein
MSFVVVTGPTSLRSKLDGCESFSLHSRLQFRFYFYGLLNAIFAPFIVIMILLYSFYRYFQVSLLHTLVN